MLTAMNIMIMWNLLFVGGKVFCAPGDQWTDFLLCFPSHNIMILIGSTVNIPDNFLIF